jgi:hypothetical protein
MAFIAGYDGSVEVAQSPGIAITNMQLQNTGDGVNWKVQAADISKVRWDSSAAFTFEVSTDAGSTWNPLAAKKIKYVIGTVEFATSQAGNLVRVATGKYLPYSLAEGVKSWSIDLQLEALETTSQKGLSDSGRRWRTYIPGLLGATISVDRIFDDETFIELIKADPQPLVIITCKTGETATSGFAAYGIATGTPLESPVDGVVMNNLEFTVTDEIYSIN